MWFSRHGQLLLQRNSTGNLSGRRKGWQLPIFAVQRHQKGLHTCVFLEIHCSENGISKKNGIHWKSIAHTKNWNLVYFFLWANGADVHIPGDINIFTPGEGHNNRRFDTDWHHWPPCYRKDFKDFSVPFIFSEFGCNLGIFKTKCPYPGRKAKKVALCFFFRRRNSDRKTEKVEQYPKVESWK